MPRYKVYRSATGELLLEVQAPLLEQLLTTVVVPLIPPNNWLRPAAVLNPTLEIANAPYILGTQFLTSIPRTELGQELFSLEEHAEIIANALNCLFKGL